LQQLKRAYGPDGSGLLVRMANDGLHSPRQAAVAATFWSEYIHTPTPAYIYGNPLEHTGDDFLNPVLVLAWANTTTMARLLGSESDPNDLWAANDLLLYAHDSNSIDQRCMYISDFRQSDFKFVEEHCTSADYSSRSSYEAYICPSEDGTFTDEPYDYRNRFSIQCDPFPQAGSHSEWHDGLSEVDADADGLRPFSSMYDVGSRKNNVLPAGLGVHGDHYRVTEKSFGQVGKDGSCLRDISVAAHPITKDCLAHNTCEQSNFTRVPGLMDFLQQTQVQFNDAYHTDYAMCWHHNLLDLINTQNDLFHRRTDLFQNWDTSDLDNERKYWGWNEVPIRQFLCTDQGLSGGCDDSTTPLTEPLGIRAGGNKVDSSSLADAYIIMLPLGVKSFKELEAVCSGGAAGPSWCLRKLGDQLQWTATQQSLPVDGASVAFAWQDVRKVSGTAPGTEDTAYSLQLECQEWVIPTSQGDAYNYATKQHGDGSCRLCPADAAGNCMAAPPSPPSPPPPSPGGASQLHISFILLVLTISSVLALLHML